MPRPKKTATAEAVQVLQHRFSAMQQVFIGAVRLTQTRTVQTVVGQSIQTFLTTQAETFKKLSWYMIKMVLCTSIRKVTTSL